MSAVKTAIHDWIRNDLGVAAQMTITPDHVAHLVARVEMTGNLSERPVGISEGNETITPPINDCGEGEPVAWRARHDTQPHRWTLLSARPERPDPHVTVQPLYAAPSPKGWESLSCDEQFELATRIAANIGYELTPEPGHPDSPHAPQTDPFAVSDEEGTAIVERAVTGFATDLAALSNPAQALPDGEVVKGAILEWLAPYKQEYRQPHDRLVELVVAALSKPSSRNGGS